MFVLYRLDSANPWIVSLIANRMLDATIDARELAIAEHQQGKFMLVETRDGSVWTFDLG